MHGIEHVWGIWPREAAALAEHGSKLARRRDQHYVLLEVEGVPDPHALFCATLTGWTEVISEAVGLVAPRVEHDQCRARGQPRCTWRITWGGMSG